MQAILSYFFSPIVPASRASVPARDDGRDKWVGIISALGVAVLLASDLVALLWR